MNRMMNRIIKFRAWHPDSGMVTFTMNDLYTFAAEGSRKASVCFQDGDIRNLEDVELMQFTGLKDSKGVAIYEGDILAINRRYKNLLTDSAEYHDIRAQIVFQNGAFWYEGDGYTDCNWHFYDAKHRLVIGNIYEHPELLESANEGGDVGR